MRQRTENRIIFVVKQKRCIVIVRIRLINSDSWSKMLRLTTWVARRILCDTSNTNSSREFDVLRTLSLSAVWDSNLRNTTICIFSLHFVFDVSTRDLVRFDHRKRLDFIEKFESLAFFFFSSHRSARRVWRRYRLRWAKSTKAELVDVL